MKTNAATRGGKVTAHPPQGVAANWRQEGALAPHRKQLTDKSVL